jgi:hypothetical protein
MGLTLVTVAAYGFKDRIHEYYYGAPLGPCVTETCIQVAASIQSAMNKTADPCSDFYNYACGGWEHSRTIPTEQTSISQFSELSDTNIHTLKRILERTCNVDGSVEDARDSDDRPSDDDDWTTHEFEYLPCSDQPDPYECLDFGGMCDDKMIGDTIKTKCPHLCCIPVRTKPLSNVTVALLSRLAIVRVFSSNACNVVRVFLFDACNSTCVFIRCLQFYMCFR